MASEVRIEDLEQQLESMLDIETFPPPEAPDAGTPDGGGAPGGTHDAGHPDGGSPDAGRR